METNQIGKPIWKQNKKNNCFSVEEKTMENNTNTIKNTFFQEQTKRLHVYLIYNYKKTFCIAHINSIDEGKKLSNKTNNLFEFGWNVNFYIAKA